jgi:TonB family protein
MAVISDKGCVCDAQVIRRADKETDKKAELAVRRWRFQPAQKDGHNLPVVVTVEVDYWRENGELVQFPATPTVMQTQDGPGH